jgi:hypothetical protein
VKARPAEPPTKVRLSTGAKLNLSGGYLVQVEISRAEIDRLFYLTHGEELDDIDRANHEIQNVGCKR